jgi:hypothetical protein
MNLVVHTLEEHTEDYDRDKDIEHNGEVDEQWELNTDSHREHKHAILNNEEADEVSEDTLTHNDENQSRE